MPQNRLTPSWWPIMLWIISVSRTVFPHPRAAEQARFAAPLERHKHIDNLDARFEDFGFGGSPSQRRRGSMDGAPLDIRRRCLNGRWRSRKRRTFAREFPCRPALSTGRPCPSPPFLAQGPAWASTLCRAPDERRVEPKLRWRFLPQLRAVTNRWAVNVHRTVYRRHCHAPRPLPPDVRRTGFVAHAISPLVSRFFRRRPTTFPNRFPI